MCFDGVLSVFPTCFDGVLSVFPICFDGNLSVFPIFSGTKVLHFFDICKIVCYYYLNSFVPDSKSRHKKCFFNVFCF